MEHIKKPIDIKSWKLAEVDLSEPMYSEMYEPINLKGCSFEIEGEITESNGFSELCELIKQQVEEKNQKKKYMKKPLEVEAIQWNSINLSEIEEFVGENLVYDINDSAWKLNVAAPTVEMIIKTLEGNMKINVGDYIVKGINGEFYPVKEDIFLKTYEPIQEEQK